MTQGTITTATAAEADAVMAVIALAFSTDPAARWAYADPQQYLRHFPSFVRAFGGNAFAHESAYYVDGYLGAALWLHEVRAVSTSEGLDCTGGKS